jgi:hypothetical protein
MEVEASVIAWPRVRRWTARHGVYQRNAKRRKPKKVTAISPAAPAAT